MHSDEALRALGGGHQLGNRNGRGVRGEDGVFLHNAIERSIHFFFRGNALDDGFDDDVAIGQAFLPSRALQPRANLIFLLRRDPALLRRPLGKFAQRLLDSGKSLIQKLLLNFEDGRVESGHRRNLGDARSHKPATENADFFDFHRSVFLRKNR